MLFHSVMRVFLCFRSVSGVGALGFGLQFVALGVVGFGCFDVSTPWVSVL